MVAINFKKEFAGEVERGIKCQTIRANDRKGLIRPGASLQLYTGMRTKSCRKLIEADPICLSVTPLKISGLGVHLDDVFIGRDHRALLKFAKDDGFESWGELLLFFHKNYGLPFNGVLIKWGDVS